MICLISGCGDPHKYYKALEATDMAYENDCLVHYGISGMHWGIRRFQNADRSLTAAGKERYAAVKERRDQKKTEKAEHKEQKKADRQARKEAARAAIPESATWKSKEARYLSDEELNRRNSRLQRERQYRDMTKSRKRKVAEYVGRAATKIFIGSLIGVAAGAMATSYKALLPEGGNFVKAFSNVKV